MKDEMQVRLLDMKDVSKLTGLSQSSLYRMRAEKPYQGPPFLRIGSAVRYPLSQLQSWIDDRVESTTKEIGR